MIGDGESCAGQGRAELQDPVVFGPAAASVPVRMVKIPSTTGGIRAHRLQMPVGRAGNPDVLPRWRYRQILDSLAAGWRPAPTLVTDPAELDDLPAGTVILDAMGRPMQLSDNRWVTAASAPSETKQVPLPATVLPIPS